jgi:hypothetical protein
VAAAGAGGAVIEEIAAVQPTTAKASSKGIPRSPPLFVSLRPCLDHIGSYADWVMRTKLPSAVHGS